MAKTKCRTAFKSHSAPSAKDEAKIAERLSAALMKKMARLAPGPRAAYGMTEMCTYLSIPRTRAYDLMARGLLERPVKCGRRVMWSADAVDRAAARILAGDAA